MTTSSCRFAEPWPNRSAASLPSGCDAGVNRSIKLVGCCASTHPPYGYRVDPARPRDPAGARLEPDEAAVVAEIFATYAQEKQSLMGITKQLMERRVPTPSGRWRWNQARVHGIVSHPIYTGTVYIGRTRATEAHQR